MTFSRRWAVALGILLLASLSANLFFIGGETRRWLGPDREARAHKRSEMRFQNFLETMPPEARPVIERVFGERRPAFQERIARIREARREVGEILAREPLDVAALDRALGQVRTLSDDIQVLVHENMREAAQQLPPSARVALAERWQQRGRSQP